MLIWNERVICLWSISKGNQQYLKLLGVSLGIGFETPNYPFIPNKLVVMRIITATMMPMARKIVLRKLRVFIP